MAVPILRDVVATAAAATGGTRGPGLERTGRSARSSRASSGSGAVGRVAGRAPSSATRPRRALVEPRRRPRPGARIRGGEPVMRAQQPRPVDRGIRMHVAGSLADGLNASAGSGPRSGRGARRTGNPGRVVPVPAGTSPVGLLRARRARPWREDADVLYAPGEGGGVVLGSSATADGHHRPQRRSRRDGGSGSWAGSGGSSRRCWPRADRVIAPSDAIRTGWSARSPGTGSAPRAGVAAGVAPTFPGRHPRSARRQRRHTPLVSCVARLHPR